MLLYTLNVLFDLFTQQGNYSGKAVIGAFLGIFAFPVGAFMTYDKYKKQPFDKLVISEKGISYGYKENPNIVNWDNIDKVRVKESEEKYTFFLLNRVTGLGDLTASLYIDHYDINVDEFDKTLANNAVKYNFNIEEQ